MQKYKKSLVAIVCALAIGSASAPAFAQTYVDGVGAYKNQDYRKAYEIWSSLAAAGDREAQYSLGVLYEEGHGVSQDNRKAVEWFLQSANNGHAEAQFNVGVAYWSGVGVEANRAKAIEYWQKSAERGLGDAQYNLGVAYAEGYGVEKDLEKAIYWFGEAQKVNHPKAQPAAHYYANELQQQSGAATQPEVADSGDEEKAKDDKMAAVGEEVVDSVKNTNEVAAAIPDSESAMEDMADTEPNTNIATGIATAVAGTAATTEAAEELPIVVGGKVKPRENDTPMVVRPNTNLIFQTLSKNQTFGVIEISGNWVKVGGYDGVLAWVYGDFVSAQGSQGTITGDNVRVRPMPNTLDSSVPMGVLNNGDRVAIISQENGWVRIRLGLPFGGWVRMDRLMGVK